jgi:hypothetical protein
MSTMIKPHIKYRRTNEIKRGSKFRWYDPGKGKWIDCTVTGLNRSTIRYIENHRMGYAYIGEFHITRREFNTLNNIQLGDSND